MRPNSFSYTASILLILAFSSGEAQAQHRGHRRAVVPIYGHGFAQWYPEPFPVFGFPFPAYGRDPVVAVRLLVTPRDAQVYVDGFSAGIVDDFDGAFQRLRLMPGPHEIVVFLRGYRTFRQHVYFNPGSTHTIRQALDALAPGEAAEPPPTPRMPPQGPGAPPHLAGVDPARIGFVTIRVQPSDASLFVDDEPWQGPQQQDRFVIELPEGPHRVRVEKAGFQTFAVDVDVRAGQTLSFSVGLQPR